MQALQPPNKISQYLNTVCEQIRWKKAHVVISEEIENHIIDQKNAFIVEGFDEETATDKAIKEMGDPVLVGTELDHTHRPKIEWSIVALTGIALLLGLAIRMFTTNDIEWPWLLTNSIISIVIGIVVMIIAYYIDFTIMGKYSKAIYLGLIIVTFAIALVSPVVNGQYLYIPFIFLLFPTAFAGIVYSMRNRGYMGIVFCGVVLAATIFIGLIIPSVSSVGIYLFTCLILLALAIINGWFNINKLKAMFLVYIPIVIIAIVFILIAIINSPYRWQRLLSGINPSIDPMGAGYIATITREVIEGAKFFGQGQLAYFNGYGIGEVLPEIHTNSLLTLLIHEFGWISFFVIMTFILALIIRSFMLCLRQKSVLGSLVATSVLITFTMQVVLYIAYNLGFTLFTPLTLPLISYGGTATIINMILIGIMLSVFKSGDLIRDNITKVEGRNKLIEIVDGKIIINLNT